MHGHVATAATRRRSGPRASGGGRADPAALAARFCAVRAATVALAAPLSAEDCALQSMPEASPVKWHLAHTTWFFETFVLERYARRHRPYDPRFRVLFNSYYHAVGERHPRPERGLLSRPSLDEVHAYRRHVEQALAPLLELALTNAELAALVELGIHHEQQHQELILTDVKHLLSKNPLEPAYRGASPRHAAHSAARHAVRGWLPFAGGIVEIGHAGATFCFDNELPRHSVLVNPFELASHPVSNGEFLAFINDGGYRRPELWLSLGWDWVQAQGWTAPLYWEQRNDSWTRFTLGGRIALDRATPAAHLSYFEADAYARWAGARLPTEFEWETAAANAPLDGHFVDDGALEPRASDVAPRPGVPSQLYGDVWEWTSSPYAAYPGYAPAPGAVGEYNGKFMCNQYVLRGGSCATPRSHVRPTYRNFFAPEARWQFCGLRLARTPGVAPVRQAA